MAKLNLSVNGRAQSVDSRDPARPLLYVLRNALGLTGAKYGCGLGQCGACTVLDAVGVRLRAVQFFRRRLMEVMERGAA